MKAHRFEIKVSFLPWLFSEGTKNPLYNGVYPSGAQARATSTNGIANRAGRSTVRSTKHGEVRVMSLVQAFRLQGVWSERKDQISSWSVMACVSRCYRPFGQILLGKSASSPGEIADRRKERRKQVADCGRQRQTKTRRLTHDDKWRRSAYEGAMRGRDDWIGRRGLERRKVTPEPLPPFLPSQGRVCVFCVFVCVCFCASCNLMRWHLYCSSTP